ncbi:MAG: hypothetical protein AVO33_08445 [delta proteobacterium ML8_F1]|nr:MAG: hypothetical protein AVO33_08445 [delta proteobacterium ML8_F1]
MRVMRQLSLFLLMIGLTSSAFANSGPVYWEGYPSTQVLAVDREATLEVKSENLIFDFTGNEGVSYNLTGDVQATYEFYNPLSEAQEVAMAFPFIGSLRNLKQEEMLITQDGEVLDYVLRLGGPVPRGNPEEPLPKQRLPFEGILQDIKTRPTAEEKAFLQREGRVYTFEVTPASEEPVNFAVDFNFKAADTQVLTSGFNRYERRDDETRIASWCRGRSVLEIFVIGEGVDFDIAGFADGALEKPTEGFTWEVTDRSENLQGYLEKILLETFLLEEDEILEETVGMLGRRLRENFPLWGGYASEMDFSYDLEQERMMVLLYEVALEAESVSEVTVNYRTRATMDHTRSLEPQYTVEYLLNPAGYWQAFEDLSIEILTSDELPYLVESTLDFKSGGKNRYTAYFKSLPEEDLVFTLYGKEQVTLYDEVAGGLKRHFGYFFPLFAGGLVLGGLVLVLLLLRRKKEQS